MKFVLHTLQRNITHLAVITRKTNIKLGILKGGGGETGKEPQSSLNLQLCHPCYSKLHANSGLEKKRLFFLPPPPHTSINFIV